MSNLFYTVEQLKINVNDENKEGFIVHLRALPVDSNKDFNIVNGNVSIEGSSVKGLPNNEKVSNSIISILTKWFNRELMMKTNVLEIDNIKEDLNDLLTLEDGLLVTESKKLIKKLNNILSIKELPKIENRNKDYIAFLEPFKVSFVDEVIKIPDEMLTTPMDITRSKIYILLNDYSIEIDKNKLNIIIDYSNNSFIVDKNMHGRTVMKALTNRDFIANQVIGL